MAYSYCVTALDCWFGSPIPRILHSQPWPTAKAVFEEEVGWLNPSVVCTKSRPLENFYNMLRGVDFTLPSPLITPLTLLIMSKNDRQRFFKFSWGESPIYVRGESI